MGVVADKRNDTVVQSERHATPAGEAAHIHHFLSRLGWATTVLTLMAVVLVAASFYWLQVVPQAEAIAKVRQNQAVERVLGRVEILVDRVDRLLVTSQVWAADGLATIDDPAAFNGLMIPLLHLRSIISSMHMASDDGRELLLVKTPDGYRNRLTDIPKTGHRHYWMLWKDEKTKLSEEWKDLDYDPRVRPWFKGAMDTVEGRVHWTEPYMFQSTQEPGITASLRWVDRLSGRQYVLAMDILLVDLSKMTREMVYGLTGSVAVVTEDGKMIGLPRDAEIESDEALAEAILQSPDSVGLPQLAAALRASGPNCADGTYLIPSGAAGNSEPISATVRRIPFGNQIFRVVMMAPEKDFSALSGRLLAVLGLVVGGVAVLSVYWSRRLANGVTRPLGRVFVELAATNRELEAQALRSSTLAALAPGLQNADTFQQLAQQLFSGIAERLPLGQGSLYRLVDAAPAVASVPKDEFGFVDDDANEDKVGSVLELCGGYARAAEISPPSVIALGEGLVGQCAFESRLIRLDNPSPGYLRVESALAGGLPASLLLMPVVSNGVSIGVLELAVLEPVSDAQVGLLESLLPMLALCMEILARACHTQELLQDSLRQSSTLAAQQVRIELMLNEQDAIFKRAPMGIVYADPERIQRANTVMAELMRIPVEGLVGRATRSMFVSPESYSEFAEKVARSFAAGEDVHIEWTLCRADSTSFTAMLSGRRIEMAGIDRAAIWMIEDISERKAFELAVLNSEARFRQVLEECPEAVTIVSEAGEHIFANRRLAELLGLSQAALTGSHSGDHWINLDERQRFLDYLHRDGRIDGFETYLRRADGQIIRVRINTRWLEQDGKRLLLSWLFELGKGAEKVGDEAGNSFENSTGPEIQL